MVRSAIRCVALFVLSLIFLFGTVDGTGADPTPSDASPPYPLNHTFDAEPGVLDTHVENYGFEASEYSTAAPENWDFEENKEEVGTPPTNADFETGDFTGWTTSGSVSVQSDGTHGYYAKLPSGASVTTDAFTVDEDQQTFVFELGFFHSTQVSTLTLHVLTGESYETSTQIKSFSCNFCNGTWWTGDRGRRALSRRVDQAEDGA